MLFRSKQKTAYEIWYGDWIQTCALPIYMFTDCLELTSITFGSGVTQVNMLASRPLSALQEIVFKSETPPTVADGFLTLTEGIQIKVPATAVETYKAAAGWSAYASCIVANTEE